MKNIFKPYSLLLHFLSLILFFFIGILYAGLVDAGKGQMLAGGAIVLGYGVMGAGIGFCISIFTSYNLNRKTIIKLNIISSLLIIGLWGYFYIKHQKRQQDKLEEQQFENEQLQSPKPTQPVQEAEPIENDNSDASENSIEKQMAMLTKKDYRFQEKALGLGMYAPNLDKQSTMYFYSAPNFEKSIQEHTPTDSITFKKSQYGDIVIQTAPPWLVPKHLKLDYGILLFKAQSITQDFIEVTVNETNQQTAFVSKYSGHLQYWPEFLLHVHSVEFPNPEHETIYVKPLDHAGTVTTTYSFMKPLRIKKDWMFVELQDDSFNSVGKGWIKWQDTNGLLVRYSLLS
ncbi:hypothetical protein ACFS5M_11070 [Lacinutrix iliipiscaria]|uniref:Uncharacterized protein n=1 Tax=Lacinutrix iliipiscaria TaxID=1230532 RepID=A0ABW5WRZ8_9FLAO